MAAIFIVAGFYLAEAGRVMWSDSHNPHVVAQIDHRRCWTSQGSDSNENLCDLTVTYRADDRVVTSRMKAVDEGGIVGHQIEVSYNPSNISDASGPENDSATALMAWGFALLLIGFGGWLLRSCIAVPKEAGPQEQGSSAIESFAAAPETDVPESPMAPGRRTRP